MTMWKYGPDRHGGERAIMEDGEEVGSMLSGPAVRLIESFQRAEARVAELSAENKALCEMVIRDGEKMGKGVEMVQRLLQERHSASPSVGDALTAALDRVAKLESAIRSFCGPFGMPRSVGTVGYIIALEKVLDADAASETGSEDDGFGCCGGNDDEPRHHTADCSVYPWTGLPPTVTPRYRPTSATVMPLGVAIENIPAGVRCQVTPHNGRVSIYRTEEELDAWAEKLAEDACHPDALGNERAVHVVGDEAFALFDCVLRWLDENGHKAAAKAAHGARDTFLLHRPSEATNQLRLCHACEKWAFGVGELPNALPLCAQCAKAHRMGYRCGEEAAALAADRPNDAQSKEDARAYCEAWDHHFRDTDDVCTRCGETRCQKLPPGWVCRRVAGHYGYCSVSEGEHADECPCAGCVAEHEEAVRHAEALGTDYPTPEDLAADYRKGFRDGWASGVGQAAVLCRGAVAAGLGINAATMAIEKLVAEAAETSPKRSEGT